MGSRVRWLSSAMGNGGPSAGGFAPPTAGRLRCASRRPTMRSRASGERSSPSPDGSETMGTTRPPERGPSELLAVAPIAAFAALASARASAAAGPGCDDVVNPKHHDRGVRRRGDGLAPDPDRLDHVLFLYVGVIVADLVVIRRLLSVLLVMM